jgi:hypothetical protein
MDTKKFFFDTDFANCRELKCPGKLALIRAIRVKNSPGKIKIRAAHEIMAARTSQFALLVDQLMPALRTKPPVLAGYIFVG